MPERIGLLGGSFDPPHNGHMFVARAARSALELDSVKLLVSGSSPHRGGKLNHASAAQRFSMAELAAGGEPGIGVDGRETRRDGPSYTVETLRELRKERPEVEWYFIVGGDMLADLPNWREPKELFQLATIVPVLRAGFGHEVFSGLAERLGSEAAGSLRNNLLELSTPPISSTAVRAAIRNGEEVSGLVPAAVFSYIKSNSLYLR